MLWGSTRSSFTYIMLLTEVTLQHARQGVRKFLARSYC